MATLFDPYESARLKELCVEVCDKLNAGAICNALLRGGIHSIGDLKKTDLDVIKDLRSFGEMRLMFIEEMKRVIDERGLS